MDYNVSEKNVLITGASNGIGALVVQYLVEEGVKKIYILDVDEEAGNKLKADLNTKLKKEVVKFIKCDVSQEDQLFGAFDEALKDCGYIDVVINNAGVADESSTPKIRKLVEINYLALVNLTLKALESMRKDHGGRGGTVLNVSSAAALVQTCPTFFVYFGTKSAVLQFSNCIGRPEFYSKTGVRVLTMCIALTNTDIRKKALSFDKEINEIIRTNRNRPSQSPEAAARGVVKTLKSGESGSTWLSSLDKPAEDISETITKAYGIMSKTFTTKYFIHTEAAIIQVNSVQMDTKIVVRYLERRWIVKTRVSES